MRHVSLATLLTLLSVVALKALWLPSDGPTHAPVQAAWPAGSVAQAGDGSETTARAPERVLAEAEYVYGPPLAGWSTAGFLSGRGGALGEFVEGAGSESLTGAQIVDRVAQEHSLSPKLLLALLELDTGAVDDPSAAPRLGQPFGASLAGPGLNTGLRSAAAWLDDGFYGLLHRQTTTLHFADGSQEPGPTQAGAGHFAVARWLAMSTTAEELPARLAAFAATYQRLFGDIPGPADRLAPPPAQPPLLLPWPEGERWHFTGGPHGGWGVATAWAAVDFAPPSNVGCGVAPEWVVAAAPGVVTRSERGFVAVDLDGDSFEGTGWALVYLHMATDGRVPVGTVVGAGDRIGHPSCEGGRSTGAHLHLARKHDGRWLPAAGGPAPLDLSGWTFEGGNREYDGSMHSLAGGQRNAVTSGRGGPSDVVSDNGPAQWARNEAAWQTLSAGASRAAAVAASAAGPAAASGAVGALQGAATAPSADPNPLLPGTTDARPVADVDPARGPSAAASADLLAASQATASASELVVHLTLPGQGFGATPFSVAILDAAGDALPMIGRTDERGRGQPLALPGVVPGRYTLIVRVPGYRPQSLQHVALGRGRTQVELGGQLVPLLAGELNRDDAIDLRDVATWLRLAARARPEADVNGDGRVTASDLGLVLHNAAR